MNIKFFSVIIWFLFVFCCMSTLYASKGYLYDPEDVSLNTTISLDFKDIEIIDALKFLAQKSGLNMVATQKVSGRVNLTVENATIKDVFDVMLRSHGLAYDKKGSIYNIMTEVEYKELYGRNFMDMREVKIFNLKYAIPDHVFNLCDSLKSEIGKIILDSESGSILVMDTPAKIKEIGKVIESLEKKTTVLKIFNLQYAQAKDIVTQIKAHLDLKKVGTIRAEERSNQLIVQTLPDRMKDIEKLITRLDQKTQQVLLDVKIIKVNLSNQLNKGIQWEGLFDIGKQWGMNYLGSYPFSAVQATADDWRSRNQVYSDVGGVGSYPFSGTSTSQSASSAKTGIENMHVGIVGNRYDFDFVFKYLRTIGETRVVANPKVTLIEGQEARVHIGEKQAYITNTTTQTTTTTTIAEEVTFIDIGIQLFFTVIINDQDFVTINVKPEISSILSFLETSEGNKIPIISTSTTETTVMVKDGSTILIGGLKEEKQSKIAEVTPILSRIPILGNFFSSKTNIDRHNEFLVMLTPHLIAGDEFTTGYNRDFGYELDKTYQEYPSFDKELEDSIYKRYQDYSLLEENQKPGIKPRRDLLRK